MISKCISISMREGTNETENASGHLKFHAFVIGKDDEWNSNLNHILCFNLEVVIGGTFQLYYINLWPEAFLFSDKDQKSITNVQ